MGSVAYAGRRYQVAIGPLDHALQLNPKITSAHALKGFCLLGLGRTTEALAEFTAETSLQAHFAGLAIAHYRLGEKAASKEAYDALVSKIGDPALYQQVQILSQWGRIDDAFATLARARRVGDTGLHYLRSDPLMDPLRSDRRFASVSAGL